MPNELSDKTKKRGRDIRITGVGVPMHSQLKCIASWAGVPMTDWIKSKLVDVVAAVPDYMKKPINNS